MDDTVEVPLTRGSEDYEARGSRDPVAHPVDTSIAHLIWCCGMMSLVDHSNQLKRREKPEERASRLVQIRRRNLRTSSRTRVSATGAATACEPELRTIHITDNHPKSLSSRSSWRTTALCRIHLTVNCSPVSRVTSLRVVARNTSTRIVTEVISTKIVWRMTGA